MTSTPLTRDRNVDLHVAAIGPDIENLDRPCRFDTARYWYGLARTDAHTIAVALAVINTSEPGSAYRADAIRTLRSARRRLAENIHTAESMTH